MWYKVPNNINEKCLLPFTFIKKADDPVLLAWDFNFMKQNKIICNRLLKVL